MKYNEVSSQFWTAVHKTLSGDGSAADNLADLEVTLTSSRAPPGSPQWRRRAACRRLFGSAVLAETPAAPRAALSGPDDVEPAGAAMAKPN